MHVNRVLLGIALLFMGNSPLFGQSLNDPVHGPDNMPLVDPTQTPNFRTEKCPVS